MLFRSPQVPSQSTTVGVATEVLDRTVNFTGVIIEESLTDKSVLDDVRIVSTKVEPVVEAHRTPWVKQWTMHNVEIAAEKATKIAERISEALDREHNWYADYKTDKEHFVIYRDEIFHITDRSDKAQYDEATKHGVSIGIPDYQVDFSPHITQWERLERDSGDAPPTP